MCIRDSAYADSLEVDPGDLRVAKGEAVTITLTTTHKKLKRAEIRRLLEDGTESVERLSLGSESKNGKKKFSIKFNEVEEDFTYRIRAGSALTQYYKVTTVAPPAINQFKGDYDFPDYTNLKSKSVTTDTGEIRAVTHTRITLTATPNKKIDQSHLDLAKDKIMMGAERKSMILSEEQKRITAFHEAGHAIVGRLCPTHDPVYKVTIIPRGRALGVTMFLPEEDTYMQSKEYLLGRITTLFGGRIAESIINGYQGITTGASNDIEVATGIATNMVTKWGFSDELGTIKYGEDEGSPFLGRSASSPAQIRSDQTSKLIDSEVKAIIDSCYERAEKLLNENLDKLNVMADALLKYETIGVEQIDDIMAGATPREPKGWSDDDSPKGKSSKKTSIKGAAEEL